MMQIKMQKQEHELGEKGKNIGGPTIGGESPGELSMLLGVWSKIGFCKKCHFSEILTSQTNATAYQK